ncbi:MAG TPA: biotin transporter BioY [Fimbriimonas sp.]
MRFRNETRGSLAAALVPNNTTLANDLGLIAIGAAATAAAAQIQIPWQPVPFTMQTLAVALCGLALGSRRGALAQLACLGGGAAGLPVFAEGRSGLATLAGPTGGFLIAFVASAWLLGRLSDIRLDRRPFFLAAGLVLSNLAVFGLGWLWLSRHLGSGPAFQLGVAPFVASELLKDAMVLLGLYGTRAAFGRE